MSLNWGLMLIVFPVLLPVTEIKNAYFVNTCGGICDEVIRRGYLEMYRLISEAYGRDNTDIAQSICQSKALFQ